MRLGSPVDSIVFVMADSREAAWRIGKTVLAVLQSVAVYEIRIEETHSFAELVRMGASADEDLRIFECAHDGSDVTEWVRAPYFPHQRFFPARQMVGVVRGAGRKRRRVGDPPRQVRPPDRSAG